MDDVPLPLAPSAVRPALGGADHRGAPGRGARPSAEEAHDGPAPDRRRGRSTTRPTASTGEVRDICIEDGRIVASLPDDAPTLDARGMVVMPGGVDIHSHVASSSCNHARRLLPDEHAADPAPPPALVDGEPPAPVGHRRHGAEHLHDRLSLRRPRLHDRVRRRGGAPHGAAQPCRARRYAVRGRRLLRAHGQRRVPAAADRRRRARAGARLRGLAAGRDRRLRDQDRESRRHRGVEVGSAERQSGSTTPSGSHGSRRAPSSRRWPTPPTRCGCRTRPTSTATISASPATSRPRRSPACRRWPVGARTSRICSSTPMAGAGQGLELGRGTEVIEYVNAHPEVSVDVGQVMFGPATTITADATGRIPAAQEQRPQVGQHRHRARDRLRHRAASLQGEGGGRGAAVGDRPRAVPADPRIPGGWCSRPIIPTAARSSRIPALIRLLMDRTCPGRAAEAGEPEAAGRERAGRRPRPASTR